MYKSVYLKKGKEESLNRFHPWIFSGAIHHMEEGVEEGDIVNVFTAMNDFIAVGHYQIGSIAVRVLSFSEEEINHSFWCSHLESALKMRQRIGIADNDNNNTYRLVHGEGDALPGLIIDCYGETMVMQAHSVGMHASRKAVCRALVEVMGNRMKHVYYKSETTLPFKAELEQENDFIHGGTDKDIAIENGLKFYVDWLHGQKTGFFIDQRENRSLLEHYAKCNKATVLACAKEPLAEKVVTPIKEAIRELQNHKPIQYILGETVFFSYRFLLDENVLIPRPETEELVDWVLTTVTPTSKPLKIIDIGTGSGCIAISLAKSLPNAEVTAVDVSAKALQVARRNAELNGVTINFLQQDILQTTALPDTYDIIISNPPYVRSLEKAEMQANVLEYEPHLALFVSDTDPLLFYDRIATLARKALSPQGSLFFEINQYLGEEMKALLKAKGFEKVVLRQDLSGNDRMIMSR